MQRTTTRQATIIASKVTFVKSEDANILKNQKDAYLCGHLCVSAGVLYLCFDQIVGLASKKDSSWTFVFPDIWDYYLNEVLRLFGRLLPFQTTFISSGSVSEGKSFISHVSISAIHFSVKLLYQ